MKSFRILINTISADLSPKECGIDETINGTKKDAIKVTNGLAMHFAEKFKDLEIFYTISDKSTGLIIRKGRIVPKITYRYVVDFKG